MKFIFCLVIWLTSDYIESDLTNSYSWDTTIIFIQKYSEYLQYSDVLSSVFGWEFRPPFSFVLLTKSPKFLAGVFVELLTNS